MTDLGQRTSLLNVGHSLFYPVSIRPNLQNVVAMTNTGK